MQLDTQADLFALLAEVFLEPEADVKVRLAALLGQCPDKCPGLEALPAAIGKMLEACEKPRDLAVEYVRLFLHGDRFPTIHPYESVYTCGRLMAPECLNGLKELYDRADVKPKAGMALPPDHLGLELEFLSFLLRNLDQSPEGSAEAQDWRGLAERLLGRHLIPFARIFTRKLENSDPHPYFRYAGQVLVEALTASCLTLGIESPLPMERVASPD
jgi:TorA maturation chaperone TorD